MSVIDKFVNERALLAFIVCGNVLYFFSCIYSPSLLILTSTFLLETFFFYRYQDSRTISAIYKDVSPLLCLAKIALFCMENGGILLLLPFILLEIYLLAFYRAGFYFKYQASSLPYLNFKDFGLLNGLKNISERLTYFQKALHVRPLAHLITLLVIALSPIFFPFGLYLYLLTLTVMFVFLCAITLRYFIYTKSSAYKKDLKDHASHHSPQVIMYVSGASGSSYQLAQWIPVLEKLEQRVTVIAREKFWIDDLKNSPLHTVFARGLEDMGNFITADTKVCLYPANAFKNTQMMRRTEMEHIFINHGESDKIVNVSRLIRAYSKLYLAGPMAKDRLEAAGIVLVDNQFTYVGRPQTSIFLENKQKKTRNILYAPTWEGFDTMSNYNSIDKLALDIIKTIVKQSDYNILFKPHPLTGRVKKELQPKLQQIKRFLGETGRGEYISGGNILQVMNECDILITDISSVMNDFLATGKPYIVTNPLGIDQSTFETQFLTVQGGYILDKASEIQDLLSAIDSTDPKKDDRERVKKYSLGDFNCSDLEKFKSEIAVDCK